MLAGQETDVWMGNKMQRKLTVGNENYRLGLGVVLRLGNVSCEAAYFILSAGGLALMNLATQAAVAHSYVLRHCDYVSTWSIAI